MKSYARSFLWRRWGVGTAIAKILKIRHDMPWDDTPCYDMTQHDMPWQDTKRHDMTRQDIETSAEGALGQRKQRDIETTQHEMPRHNTKCHNTTRHDTTWHETIRQDKLPPKARWDGDSEAFKNTTRNRLQLLSCFGQTLVFKLRDSIRTLCIFLQVIRENNTLIDQ